MSSFKEVTATVILWEIMKSNHTRLEEQNIDRPEPEPEPSKDQDTAHQSQNVSESQDISQDQPSVPAAPTVSPKALAEPTLPKALAEPTLPKALAVPASPKALAVPASPTVSPEAPTLPKTLAVPALPAEPAASVMMEEFIPSPATKRKRPLYSRPFVYSEDDDIKLVEVTDQTDLTRKRRSIGGGVYMENHLRTIMKEPEIQYPVLFPSQLETNSTFPDCCDTCQPPQISQSPVTRRYDANTKKRWGVLNKRRASVYTGNEDIVTLEIPFGPVIFHELEQIVYPSTG